MIAGYAGLSADAIAAAATGSTEGLPEDEVGLLSWTDRLLDEHTLGGSQLPRRFEAAEGDDSSPTW